VQPNAFGTQGFNRFGYTAANPTAFRDPSGHTSLSDYIPKIQVRAGQLEAEKATGFRATFVFCALGIANGFPHLSGFPIMSIVFDYVEGGAKGIPPKGK